MDVCRSYNYHISANRVCVERAFGLLQGRFPILRNQVKARKMSNIRDIVRACIHLHNFCVDEAVRRRRPRPQVARPRYRWGPGERTAAGKREQVCARLAAVGIVRPPLPTLQ